MPIPAGAIPVTDLDVTADSPALARSTALLPVVQQFNQLIASANTASGMAVLDASGFLAGYGRLSAAQTWTAANTFTASGPIALSSGGPYIQGRNTGVALPNGLWRMYLSGNDGSVTFVKNSAAAGDFSTASNVMVMLGTQVTFAVPVAGPNAVAAGDYVNKGQVNYSLMIRQGSNANIAASTTAVIPFDTADSNPSPSYDLVNDNWTPAAGNYIVNVCLQLAYGAAQSGLILLSVYKNGAQHRPCGAVKFSADTNAYLVGACSFVASGTDIIDFRLNNPVAAALTVQAGSNLAVHRVTV